MVAFDGEAIGFPEDRNPFKLPYADRVDVALVSGWWYSLLTTHFPDRTDGVLREIRDRSDYVVGLDGPDRFSLSFSPEAMGQFEIVVKFQGIYRDRDLYNYEVGPLYDGALWTEKLRPRRERYNSADLEKLRLSVPSFITDFPIIRRENRVPRRIDPRSRRDFAARASRFARNRLDSLFTHSVGVASQAGRTRGVHCLTGLSHVQRIDALRSLHGLSGTQGITPTQGKSAELVFGTAYGGMKLPLAVSEELEEEARPFFHPTMSRLSFILDLRRHQVVVAPTGYGEICYRHGEALLGGAALVCQDLGHVEMMLPLIHRQNAAFCRPDLGDLRAVVQELLDDDAERKRIALNGRRDFMRWADNAIQILSNGLESHIHEAARSPGLKCEPE